MTKLDHYLIWSNAHKAWWRMFGYGYTADRNEAGKFSREDAIFYCAQATITDESSVMSDMPVYLGDIEAVLDSYDAQHGTRAKRLRRTPRKTIAA